ncbi:MAG: NPCBM/NEW2 domain-containing protein [Isosphaeraceae bacterium]
MIKRVNRSLPWFALLAGMIHVGAPGEVTLAAPPDPVFSARLTDGSNLRGKLREIDPNGVFTLESSDGTPQTLPRNRVVKLVQEGASLSLKPEGSVLIFPDGDRIHRASVGAANETTVDVQAFSLPGNLAVPLESLLGIVFTLPQEGDAAEAVVRRVREAPRSTEVLWLANDDRLDVGFLGMTEKAVQYQLANRPESLDRSRISTLGFDPALVTYPEPADGFVELTLGDGSRLGVVGARLEQGQIVGTARFGSPIRVPIRDVVWLHARSPSVVYLTRRTPAAEKLIPYVGPTRPVRKDATVEGHPFRLQGEEFDRGLGAQSRTLLAYRLEPGDLRFQATVGVDDRAGSLGSVVFKVRVDNQEVFVSPPMAAGDPPRSIDVDLKDATTLILFTEFGQRGGVRDLADWVEARIIR